MGPPARLKWDGTPAEGPTTMRRMANIGASFAFYLFVLYALARIMARAFTTGVLGRSFWGAAGLHLLHGNLLGLFIMPYRGS